MAEQEERNGDVEFLKYRNQLSRRYHGGNWSSFACKKY
jgi:hypothetical protein